MVFISKIEEIKLFIKGQKKRNKTIGFVPTMGFLHEGHCSLIKRSKDENDITIVSIFVNPTQFGPNEDFEKYPRDMEKDKYILEKSGVDVVFIPNTEEMYPLGYTTYINVEKISEKLCGESRPGHFRGVTTVVCKLFNIITPDNAYFGQKDAQQVIIIKKMLFDLNIDIEIVICPIIRELDGLAMSSRNKYLDEKQRKTASILYKSLCEAKDFIKSGEKNSTKIVDIMVKYISSEDSINIEYISIVDCITLENQNQIEAQVLIALAARVGNTRLIDNIIV
jgi:pantoate--beta-alanine ligase